MDDTEWKEKLTPEQYRILRKAGTERPFGEVYSTFKKQGLGKYVCEAVIQNFLAQMKNLIPSVDGLPSMTLRKPKMSRPQSIIIWVIPHGGSLCSLRRSPLGHVFTGEGFDTPTDKRYCINGTVLKFIPAESADSEEKPKKPVSPGK